MGKCTSAVSLPNQIEFWCRACVFLRSKKRGISSLCNWRLERRVGAQRLGDYGKMSLSWTFSSLISHFASFFPSTLHNFRWACFQNVARPLYTKVQVCLFFFNTEHTRCCYSATSILHCTICWNTILDQRWLMGLCCYILYLSLGKKYSSVDGYHVAISRDRWLMDSVKLSARLIKVILWECP